MCNAGAVQLGIAIAGAATSAQGQYQQAKVSARVAENNAIIANRQAEEAERVGEENAQAIRRRASQLTGQQRAAFSARGIDISEGTPADIIDQTDFFGQADAITARNNARKQAWGYRAQGANFAGQGAAATSSGYLSATGSLLGGASSVADKWKNYNKG